ncbi:hypothetical protein DAERI_030209 [Deinococcus aerius]|uniref:Uncharacterized protein n=1 Tax=Deinococcus aerius TaxID=200253 RepID=A0A2I9CTF1_9DEIO|nr:HD-GYP domain-containing protein [Deinococcus aerius]GBF05043.1 hypothetical protein DAERI_030209 [Deinococcus aerius]
MNRRLVLTYLWLVLGLGVLGYAALVGHLGLLIGAALLLAGVTWPLGGGLRWTAPAAYLMGFLASLVLHGPGELPDLLGGLLVAGALGGLTVREKVTVTRLTWTRRTAEALQSGSERLAQAGNVEAISRAGVEILQGLDVAPHIAFVAYRQGTPVILAGRGAYAAHMQRPIYPGDEDSRSVQADHWVAGEVLTLLRREERASYHVAEVYGGAAQHLGMLVLARPEGAFAAAEIAVVASFARLMGAQLGQWQAIRDLREANDLTLRSLGAALERRDDDTGGHTTRVVSTSVRLAERLGWDEERVGALRWGAYLHDLGKLAIPDRILHKRGPLDPEERRIIQTHAALGYDMLQDLHFLPAGTLDLVRYHHERWDGGGYPAGLRGKDIPETARLFAIVDVYDALISARPYKPAWTRHRALAEIRAGAGRQFDPQYVEAFLHLMTEQDDVRLVV